MKDEKIFNKGPMIQIKSMPPKKLEKVDGSSGDYQGMKRYWHENKGLIIGTGSALAILAYVALAPLGGYNNLKQKWTKPLEQKVQVAEKEKGKYADLYNNSKGTIDNLVDQNKTKETELKTKEAELTKLRKTAEYFKTQSNKSTKLNEMVTEFYNPNVFYDAQINATENALELQTAALNMGESVNNKYNMTFCGARYIINEDLKDILGDKWKPYADDFVKGNIDLDLDLPKYGKELRLVKWEKYDTIFEHKGAISLTDINLKSIKRMMDRYREDK